MSGNVFDGFDLSNNKFLKSIIFSSQDRFFKNVKNMISETKEK